MRLNSCCFLSKAGVRLLGFTAQRLTIFLVQRSEVCSYTFPCCGIMIQVRPDTGRRDYLLKDKVNGIEEERRGGGERERWRMRGEEKSRKGVVLPSAEDGVREGLAFPKAKSFQLCGAQGCFPSHCGFLLWEVFLTSSSLLTAGKT